MPRCIFCKSSSNSFTATEHIIPQSLGNIDHTLPKGVVCDKCNNYFAIKIESKVLNSGYLRNVRSWMSVPSKKGKMTQPTDSYSLPGYRLMGRFLGKIGLEILTSRAIGAGAANWEDEIINHAGLDSIRNFVRYDKHEGDWIFGFRLLHPADKIFFDGKQHYELLHEYDILYTEQQELYIITSLFGVEFSINLGAPFINGYQNWLKRNNYVSPLYIDKNNF